MPLAVNATVPIFGVLNLDKPTGMRSARAVGRVKHLLRKSVKVGHAGTLDPLATGVLLVLVGKATRWSEALMSEPKQYETTIQFGATTETDDTGGAVVPYLPAADSRFALPCFTRFRPRWPGSSARFSSGHRFTAR